MRIFIGSSNEGEKFARFAEAILPSYGLEPVLWRELFPPGTFTLEALYKALETTEGAVFFATPDDRTWYRDEEHREPRDNITFEAGLFLAVHGRKRVALIVPSTTDEKSGEEWKAKLPSDLAGLTYAGFVLPPGQDLAKTELAAILRKVAAVMHEERQQFSDLGAALTDEALKRLLPNPRVRLVHAVVAPWTEINGIGIGTRMRDFNARKVDILAAYRVNEVVREMRQFRGNPDASLRICFADMFDMELNALYRRKYVDRTLEQLQERLVDSLRMVLIGEERPDEMNRIRIENNKLVIEEFTDPPAASYEVYLTRQRITFSYYRIDRIAWVIPLDMKRAKGPSPYAWAISRDRNPEVFNYYLHEEFEDVIEDARRIYPRSV